MMAAHSVPHVARLIGLGIVLLLHLLLLIAIGNVGPEPLAQRDTAGNSTAIVMLALPAPPSSRAAVVPAPHPRARRTPRSVPHKAAAPRSSVVQTVPAAPALPSASAPAVSDSPIDVEAAIKSAGRMRFEDDRAVAQIGKQQRPNKTLDEKFGQQVAKSARADCKTAHADVGLLAPLFMARDALRDNGCKW